MCKDSEKSATIRIFAIELSFCVKKFDIDVTFWYFDLLYK